MNSIKHAIHDKRFFIKSYGALIILLICRICSMCLIPLNDVSEARYAEIARKMLETGNWVTLQHDYGVPFWAKPPLSTWASAWSMGCFGVNEFAVRLPGLLFSIAVLGLVWSTAKKQSGPTVAMLSTLVLAGTLYFFLNAGTVMTDPALVFCTTFILIAFWNALAHQSSKWSYLFFVGLGLGLLAKGPVAIVLAAMPAFIWVLIYNQWGGLWNRLPWFSGLAITLVIALPWYLWAEIRTPGFLNYFIMGEHVHRFLTPGWTGDKYGFAHQEPLGMIWVFAAVGIFPWCLLGLGWFISYRKSLPNIFKISENWFAFVFLCTFVPLIFFSFSRNIIYTYVFPSIPFFALFFTEYWVRAGAMLQAKNWIIALSLICGLVFVIAVAFFNFQPDVVSKTHKQVIANWLALNPSARSLLVYWDYKTEFSAQFYSHGRAKFIDDNSRLCDAFHNNERNYLVISPARVAQLNPIIRSQLTKITEVNANGRPLFLYAAEVKKCS